ncbi:transposase DNA-binding-containing protein [Calidithermus roseus]|uniref:IS4/Tn5 family transposase DNA-binding protein n=1 Tax=Calidithermus roseus TaxID=1644118 RepID=UPI000E654C2D
MELHPEDPVQWASLHFAEAELGDTRRVKRAEGMAAAMLRAPGESLSQLFVHPRRDGSWASADGPGSRGAASWTAWRASRTRAASAGAGWFTQPSAMGCEL